MMFDTADDVPEVDLSEMRVSKMLDDIKRNSRNRRIALFAPVILAAAVLGAGPLRRFRTVTLPLAAPGVVAGLTLGFARSLGEFGATITLAGSIAGETRTLPLAIYQGTQVPGGDGAALRLTVVSVLLSAAALMASELVVRRLRRGVGGGQT